MFRLAKIIIFYLFFCLPSLAYATPQFTFLGKNQPAPFEGALFNPEATAEILAKSQLIKEEYELQLGFELEKQSLELNLQIDTLHVRIGSLEEQLEVVTETKDKEIDALHKLVKGHSPSNNVWWAIGGAAVGIATSAFVVHVAK
jgi:hypothetical protein